MTITIAVSLMLLGFVSLYFGAEWLVDGAIKIAARLKIAKAVVGLVLVAFGTSSPELFVNLIAALDGRTGLALSNVSGSNLTNICIGFGLCALLGVLIIHRSQFWLDLLYFALTPLLIFSFMLVAGGDTLPYWSVFPLYILFVVYLILISGRAIDEVGNEDEESNLPWAIFKFLAGCVGLYAGGEFVVRNAVTIGEVIGISEAILGLTIVAIGTSIPDAAASIIAVRKGETDIAVGNLLGSNIFNILLILSTTLLFSNQGLLGNQSILIDYAVVTGASLFFIMLISLSHRISRFSGVLLLILYFGYMGYRVTAAFAG